MSAQQYEFGELCMVCVAAAKNEHNFEVSQCYFVFLQHITSDSYIPCLADLCKALWEVMLSYYRTMQWHENHDQDEAAVVSSGKKLLEAKLLILGNNFSCAQVISLYVGIFEVLAQCLQHFCLQCAVKTETLTGFFCSSV